MKSIATESALLLGIGRGCSGPSFLVVDDLLHIHSEQEGIYADSRSLHIFGQ